MNASITAKDLHQILVSLTKLLPDSLTLISCKLLHSTMKLLNTFTYYGSSLTKLGWSQHLNFHYKNSSKYPCHGTSKFVSYSRYSVFIFYESLFSIFFYSFFFLSLQEDVYCPGQTF